MQIKFSSYLILLTKNQLKDVKKKLKRNSVSVLKKYQVKSKQNQSVLRLKANKHNTTLSIKKFLSIPIMISGLWELTYKWKRISSIYVGCSTASGTTSLESGKSGLSQSIVNHSVSVSPFPTQQCESLIALLGNLISGSWF